MEIAPLLDSGTEVIKSRLKRNDCFQNIGFIILKEHYSDHIEILLIIFYWALLFLDYVGFQKMLPL